MEIKRLMKEKNISFNNQEYDDNTTLFKIEKKINLVRIEGKTSTFSLERDLFYYLDNQKIPYSFLLINSMDKRIFYLDFKSKKNWLSSGFERSDKENLYFGKIVLNNQCDLETVMKKINRRLV